MSNAGSILDRLDVTLEELTGVVDENPSLRGMLVGYLAEIKLRSVWFTGREGVTHMVKHDDHDRRKKGDLWITYNGADFVIEVKGLQKNSIRRKDGRHRGIVQCDASDRRPVTLADGSTLETTCLLVGEFDVLAACLFYFDNIWRYIFAKNADLPRSKSSKYTPEQREQLLKSSMPVSWPPEPPYYEDPFALFDEISRERTR